MTHENTPPAAVARPAEQERPTKGRLTAIIGSLAFAGLIMILNETVLSVALPSILEDFRISETTGGWLTTGFLLTMAVVIPTTGYLLRRFSTRALFVAALLLFIVGTALAALAPGFLVLLLARVVQASGTAIVLPLLMTTTLNLVPITHRGSVMGLIGVVISVAPAIGPTVSGVVMHAFSWRMVFGVVLPLALLTLVVGFIGLGRSEAPGSGKLDVVSIPLSVIGFGALVYGLSSASQLAEGNLVPAVGLVVGAASLVLFIRRQNRLDRQGRGPLLSLEPLGIPVFRRGVLVLAIGMATALGSIVVLPLYLQNGRGFDPLAIGLALLPGGLLQAALSSIFGRVYDRFGPRPLVIPGAILLPTALFGFATMSGQTPLGAMIGWHMLFCTGMAMLMTALMTHSLGALPQRLYPHGSAIVNTVMQLAGATGTALLLTAFSIGIAVTGTAGTGARFAFLFAGALALLPIFIVPRLRKHSAEEPAAA
ncbi:DHA2 family efflux MFS transporter permease subunit [Rothia halotolerans]|uniref:DHA2 family efflux MFS transporter permease subunit n=1 Tax=Rothia halotolerans TaxID=405770 RepID=UPI00101C071B|nr:DHA2 family efflux MFS transporter permease subunit [Rothia halotolerans]